MDDNQIFFTIEFENIAPDTEADAQKAVKEAIVESALLAGFGPEIEVGFEQRAPLLSVIAYIVAVFKLAFKDIPDTSANMKRFYNYLRSRLSNQVQIREVKIKTKHGEFIIKTNDPVQIETPDFDMILKPRK